MNGGEVPDQLQCEMYDPTANTWTICSPYKIGDIAGIVLPDNTCWAGSTGTSCAITAESPINWTAKASCPGGMDEISMCLLPDGSIFCMLPNSGLPPVREVTGQSQSGYAFRYYSSTDTWVSCGSPPNQIVSLLVGQVGPAALLPNGTVFQVGGYPNGETAIWTPDGTTSGPGSWAVGPVIDSGNAWSAQGPAAVLPNGHLLFAAGNTSGSGGFAYDSSLYEWDGSSLSSFSYSAGNYDPTFAIGMLNLPNGQCVITSPSGWYLYTPANTGNTSPPVITSCPTGLLPGYTYNISGQLFNGLTAGSYAGSYYQNASNYPLMSLTSGSNVVYCRTHGHSTMAVNTGSATVSTNFDVPATLAAGNYNLSVIATALPALHSQLR